MGSAALCCTGVSPAAAQENAPTTHTAPTDTAGTASAEADAAATDEAVDLADLAAAEELVLDAAVLVVGEPVEVTVVGARVRRTPGSVHLLPEQTLKRYAYDDVHAALQMVPGVYVRQEDGVGLRPNIGIRGALSDRSKKITLLEDGVPFAPAPYTAPAAYEMNLQSILKGERARLPVPKSKKGVESMR